MPRLFDQVLSVTRRAIPAIAALAVATLGASAAQAADAATAQKPSAQKAASKKKPNILVIWGDDIGQFNVSAYNMGMMGYKTPNIDRIGREGAIFTDWYGQQSCTAGRAAFLTGQSPIRTGLTKVGLPGAPEGMRKEDPTIATLLKAQGYATGQFGKNHLGDRDDMLPTVHGFDEFFGNLYHLNAEEEPELRMWSKDPGFNSRYRPRGVLDSVATQEDDATVDPRFGKVGKQKIRDTGPLTTKRMETVDEEFVDRTKKFITSAAQAKQPFLAWFNPSRMHLYTHLKPASRNLASDISSEFDIYGSGLMEHDGHVGQLLKLLDDLKIADNTIVVYTTDNGAMVSWWPDAGSTPFRGEKASTWEGGVRVPMLVRWPAKIPMGKVSNGLPTLEDMFTTLAAAAGYGDVRGKLKARDKVCIDGVDNLAHWTGNTPSARNVVYYYDETKFTAVRVGPWKSHFMTREGFFDYHKPSSLIFNLRMDPFERHGGQKSNDLANKMGVAFGGQIQDAVNELMATFKECKPRQEGGSIRMGGQ
ncbi:MAG: arylsulfatase [Pseudomonadota bacterium]